MNGFNLSSRAALGIALSAVLAFCAVPYRAMAAGTACEREALRAHQVLPAEDLANWVPVNDRAVLIWTQTSRRAYLVGLSRPLFGLTGAPIITLVATGHSGTISACGRDAVTLGDRGAQRVRIAAIRLLSEKMTRQLERAARASLHPMASI